MTRVADAPAAMMPGDRVEVRLTTLAKEWTPATYDRAATHMQGWHWVETPSGQRACVHRGRVRRPR